MFARPSLSRRRFLIGAAAVLSTAPAPAYAGTGHPEQLIPPEQAAFARVIDDYYVRAEAERDQAARQRLILDRGQALRATLGPSGQFERWTCALYSAAPMESGKLLIGIGVGGTQTKARIGFSSPDFSGKHGVAIYAKSQLGAVLLSMTERSIFLASGALIQDESGGFTNSVGLGLRTAKASEFSDPGFLVRLDRAEQPAWLEDLLQQR